MRIPVLTMAVMLGLAGCATTGGGKLAVCDGKHLRPANPYGTVLAPTSGGEPPAAAGSVEPKPKSLSSTAAPRSFGSC
jgi:hypothetical protein